MSEANQEFVRERQYFDYILKFLREYREQIITKKKDIDEKVLYSLKHYNSDNAEQFFELSLNTNSQNYLNEKIKNVNRAVLKPYFARVDFKPDDEDEKQELYIGKTTLFRDDDNALLVIDWRAPVSSLYYEGRLGEASYDCPDGTVTGDITLKRQYIIENSELVDLMDIDITANDEFLQAALGSSKDKRLKDIVSTIQAEQNRIIRADMYNPLIVQGAAGGGKTTIALHRIAYLLYAHDKKLFAKNIMILAPNRFFLSYISDVLPDLGVENVTQTTFEDFALEFIGQKIKVRPPVDMISKIIENKMNHTAILMDIDFVRAANTKASLKFAKLIDRYCSMIINKVIPSEDFVIEGHVLFTKERIRRFFLEDYSYLCASKRINEIKKNLTNRLKIEKPKLIESLDAYYDKAKNELKRDMPDNSERAYFIRLLLDERDAKIQAIQNRSKTLVKNYLDKFKILSPLKYYTILFQNEDVFQKLSQNTLTPEEVRLVLDCSMASFKEGFIETEDLAPIMHLKYRLYGDEDFNDIQHIVIDEAQDYSLFQFNVLREITGNQSFSILGDLSQGVHSYKGVQRWDDVLNLFDRNPRYMTLVQSYRTTVEIMNKANDVIRQLWEKEDNESSAPEPAMPVIRHGNPVKLLGLDTLKEIAQQIDSLIKDYKSDKHNSIAVICKTKTECDELKALMKSKIQMVGANDKSYSGGVVMIPSYLAKGLEFDAVIIANASSDNYSDNDLDIKLLYIAMTRALHELSILYHGSLTPLINISKWNNN